MRIKYLVVIAVLATAILFSGGAVKAVTIADLQAQIANLMAQLQALQAQQGTTPASAWCYTFNKNLGFAQSGTKDVAALHYALLQKEGFSYSPDDENTYDEDTAAAVIQFQAKYGIRQTGYVGPIARAKLNSLYGCSATQPLINISWSNGTNKVLIGLIDNRFETDGTILGYILLDQGINGSFTWNGQSVSDLAGTAAWNPYSLSQGPFRIIGVTANTAGNLCTGAVGNCNYVLSNSFNLSGSRNINLPSFSSTPSITVTSPNGGEQWAQGSTHAITWTKTNNTGGNVKIELYKGGILSSVLKTSADNDGKVEWDIPSTLAIGNDYIINITSNSDSAIADTSNNYFSIVAPGTPSITVTSPNGGENWIKGQSHTITWHGTNYPSNGYVALFLQNTNGASVGVIKNIFFSPGNSISNESYLWDTSTLTPIGQDQNGNPYPIDFYSGSYKVRAAIIDYAANYGSMAPYDESNNYFSIVAPSASLLKLNSPSAGETVKAGSQYTIRWSATQNLISAYPYVDIALVGIVNQGCDPYGCGLAPTKNIFVRVFESIFGIGKAIAAAQTKLVIAKNISLASGSYTWNVPSDITSQVYSYNGTYKLFFLPAGTDIYQSQFVITPYTDNIFTIVTAQPSLVVKPTSLVQGQQYNFSGVLTNATPNQRVYFYLKDPNGTMLANSRDIGVTSPYGYFYADTSLSTDSHAITGIYTGWVKVAGVASNYVYFTVTPSTQPSITVTSPNVGENWRVGETQRISWSASGVNYVRIYVYDPTISGSGSTNYVFDGAISAGQGYYNWTIQKNQLPGGSTLPRNYVIRIDGVDSTATGAEVRVRDSSDGSFSITDPILSIACPSVPCYFDGKTILNSSGTIDSPPYLISAKYPYEFNLLTQSNVRMTLRYMVWQKIPGIVNTMYVKVDGKLVFVESRYMNDWETVEINPGTLSSGKHTIEIYAFPDEKHFMFDWFKIEATTITPSLTVTSPNGGEQWAQGSSHPITWTKTSGTGGSVRIELYKAGVLSSVIKTSVDNDDKLNSWDIPSTTAVGSDYKIKITGSADSAPSDFSDANFSIVAPGTPSITVTSPSGGESFHIGSQIAIRWSTSNYTGSNVDLFLRRANTASTFPADSGAQSVRVANTGSYTMTIGNIGDVGQFYLRALCVPMATCNIADSSLFTINASQIQSSITVTSPNGGETLEKGKIYSIRWTSSNVSTVAIRVMDMVTGVEYRFSEYGLSDSVSAVLGSYSWTVPQSISVGSNYKVAIANPNNISIADISDNYFSIVAPTNPFCTDSDGGINYNIKGYVSTNYNGQDPNFKTYDSCMIPDPLHPSQQIGVPSCSGSNCQVQDFYCNGNAGPYGSFTSCPNGCSDGACITTPVTPSITVTSPNGGETWKILETHNITWTATAGIGSSVTIKLLKAGSPIKTISSSAANSGSFSWTIPITYGTNTNDYKITITDNSNASIYDSSNNDFTIAPAPILYNASQDSLASIATAIQAILQQVLQMYGQ